MFPSVIKLPNYHGFLFSYDNLKWWGSPPLPDDIDEVIDVVWVYGEHFVVSARLIDGTYSIYQSYYKISDNQIYWRVSLNTSERITCMHCPDYGIVLVGTSDGWWRSIDSGHSFTKSSTSAKNCTLIKSPTGSATLAASGRVLYKTIDIGSTWTTAYTFSNTITAMAGTFADFFVATGSLLYHSEDFNFLYYTLFDVRWSESILYTITDIELTALRLSDNDSRPAFVIVRDIGNGLLRTYYAIRNTGASPYLAVAPKFNAFSSIRNSLISEEFQITGQPYFYRTVTFTGTDGSHPYLKRSYDGGATWSDNVIGDIEIYDGPNLNNVIGGPLYDDVYFTVYFGHGLVDGKVCHNGWRWTGSHFDKCQSYDADCYMESYELKIATYDAYPFMLWGHELVYRAQSRIEELVNLHYHLDGIIELGILLDYDADMLLESLIRKNYRASMYLDSPKIVAYQANALMVSSEFPTFDLPQGFNVRFPAESEQGYPFDSRLTEG